MLSTRIATAIAGIPLILGTAWLGVPFLAGLAAVVGFFAAFEYVRLVKAITDAPSLILAILLTVGMIQAAAWGPEPFRIAVAAALAVTILAAVIRRGDSSAFNHRLLRAAGPYCIGVPLGLAVLLRGGADGLEWALTAILCTFAVDTGAYAVGKLLGRWHMAPAISPNKTWEGTAGGLMAGVGAAIGLTLIFGLPMALWAAAVFGLLLGIAATGGDLAESSLKRAAGVKDSGAFVPGHGGLLDRMDSLMAALVFTYIWAGQAV